MKHIIKHRFRHGEKDETWCGTTMRCTTGFFVDAQHAALCADAHEQACLGCVDSVIKCLEKYKNDERCSIGINNKKI